MKRFLAFSYDDYYPCGGKWDFVGDFDSVDVAIVEVRAKNMDVLDTTSGIWTCFTSEKGRPYTRDSDRELDY